MTIQNLTEPEALIDAQRDKSNLTAVNIGLGANVFLAIIKTTVGIIGHSPALLADGIMSTSDVVYGLVVAIFMHLSHKPADREHPFGHRQFESIAALTISAFVLTTGVGIFWDAVNSVYDRAAGLEVAVMASPLAFWVALLTVGIKICLFIYTRRVGQRHNNLAVKALAYDHRNDIFSAAAALTGISLGRLGYTWVDPLAAAIVAILILRTGIQILRESAWELMDTVPGDELEAQVLNTLRGMRGIQSVEEIRVHRFGPYLVMNLTICVDGTITVAEGDRISSLAEQKLRRSIDLLQLVHIHYHPASRHL